MSVVRTASQSATSRFQRPNGTLALRTRMPVITFVVCPILFLVTGCPQPTSIRETSTVEEESSPQDDLELAMASVKTFEGLSFREFARGDYERATPEDARTRVNNLLNEWITRFDESSVPWTRERLVERVPRSVREIPPVAGLERLKFDSEDYEFFVGRRWQRDIVRAEQTRPLPKPYAAWIAEKKVDKPDFPGEALSFAINLFDWTVRNVQLEPYPEKLPESEVESAIPPSQRGIPGPGYQRYPNSTLLIGKGDAQARAWLFVELCRNAGLDSVLIFVEPKGGAKTFWCVGVLVQEDIYLFEPELGLPIPAPGDSGPSMRGIATLNEAVSHPEILAKLSLNDSNSYRIRAEDLANCSAQIVASPIELSRRMKIWESKLLGDDACVLTCQPSAIAERLKTQKNLSNVVSLWRVPFDAYLYRIGREQYLAQRPDEQNARILDETVMVFPLLRAARKLHLKRKIERTDTDVGASQMYMQVRKSDGEIEEITVDSEVQARIIPEEMKKQMDKEKQKLYFEDVAAKLRRAKQDASYWVGLAQFELGEYDAALEWFDKRTFRDKDSPWLTGARYNLSRVYEAKGDWSKACDQLEKDRSAQSYGNRLRAKWLRELHASDASHSELKPSSSETQTQTAEG